MDVLGRILSEKFFTVARWHQPRQPDPAKSRSECSRYSVLMWGCTKHWGILELLQITIFFLWPFSIIS